MQITEIRPKPHQKGIYQIFVEGKFWAEVLDESVVKFGLRSGKDIPENHLAEIFTLSRRPLALHLALNHLERWAKTKKQLKQYLFEKGFALDDVDFVVWRLEELNILNDRKFAEYYISAHKTKGKRTIKYELKMKGVADEIINDCLEKMGDQEDVILHLAKKFVRNKSADPKLKEKLFRHLVSKGFGFEETNAAINKILKGENDESWD